MNIFERIKKLTSQVFSLFRDVKYTPLVTIFDTEGSIEHLLARGYNGLIKTESIAVDPINIILEDPSKHKGDRMIFINTDGNGGGMTFGGDHLPKYTSSLGVGNAIEWLSFPLLNTNQYMHVHSIEDPDGDFVWMITAFGNTNT